jgi:hypothetical protein
MRDMSRAIRHELEEYGPTLREIPDETLTEFAEILGALFYDLVGEKERRGLVAQRPSTVVAQEIKRLKARVTAHHELSTLSKEAIAESLGGTCQICVRAIESVDPDSTAEPGLPLSRFLPGDDGGLAAP